MINAEEESLSSAGRGPANDVELLPCPFCGSEPALAGRTDAATLDEYLDRKPNLRCSNGKCGVRYTQMSWDEWQTRAG